MKSNIKSPKVLAVAGGFYFFGDEVQAEDGYIALERAAMFGGFGGNKGVAGVCRGDKAAKVTLDRFDEDGKAIFPIGTVYAILPSINLYEFAGTTLR